MQPENAVEYWSPYFDIPYPYPSEIDLHLATNDTFEQSWVGGEWVMFQGSGQLRLKIEINVFPTEYSWDLINWTTFSSQYNPFTTSVTIPNVYIESSQEAKVIQQQTEQQRYEKMNLSLTFIVLLLASVEIAIALYYHSQPDDDTPDYDRAYKKHEWIDKSGQDYG